MFRRALFSLLLGLTFAAAPTAGVAQVLYGWTLSASPTDPLVNVIPLTSEPIPVYLWFYCGTPTDGISAAELTLLYPPTVTVFSFDPAPGVTNSGSTSDLNLSISGCPRGSFLAGHLTAQGPPAGQFTICFGGLPSPNVSYGCAAPSDPVDNATLGLVAGYDEPCSQLAEFFKNCTPTDAIDEPWWGEIKSRYLPQ